MVTYSDFQNKYPLSKKKFWKKVIQLIPSLLSSMVGLVIFGFIILGVAINSGRSITIFYLLIGFMFLTMLVIFIANIIYIHYYIKYYFFDCNEQFITIKKHPITPREIHVQYNKIQDVYVDQDIFDRILDIYDVHIASATVSSGIEAHIDGVDHDVAEAIKNFLLDKLKSNGSVNMNQDIPSNKEKSNNNSISIKLDKKISSNEYPVSDKYIFSIALSMGFISLFLPLMFIGLFVEMNFSAILFFYIIMLIVVFAFLMGGQYLWIKAFYFEFAPDYILCKTGFLSKKETHIPYKNIQNVTTNQGILARIFHIKDIVIENAAQGLLAPMVLFGQPENKAEEITSVLNDLLKKVNRTNNSSNGL